MKISKNGDDVATFDDMENYRYRLIRVFEKPDVRRAVFVMLNPSTADAFKNDPTVTRCCNFAKSWGYTSLEVVNIFALRSTDPKALYVHGDPIGPDNDFAILSAVRDPSVGIVVCAWGAHGKLRRRGTLVRHLLREVDDKVHYLSMTMEGQPGHPLYLKSTLEPIKWQTN